MKISTELAFLRLILAALLSLLSCSTFGQDISYVQVPGYGESLNEARVSAARAALAQYVGTFIDASYTVEERTVIENDYVSESSIVEENIFEYSQGVIRSIDVFSGTESDGFYEIEARVGISRQATETFISEKLSEIREVDSGLFATIIANRENRIGQFEIFMESVWTPLLENSAIEIGISGEVAEATLEQYPGKRDNGKVVLRIPITIRVTDTYLNRAIESLANIARHDTYTDNMFWRDSFPVVRDFDLAPITRVFIGDFSYQLRGRQDGFRDLRLPATSNFGDVRYKTGSEVRVYTIEGETAGSICDAIPDTPFGDAAARYNLTMSRDYIFRVVAMSIEFIGDTRVLDSRIINTINAPDFPAFTLFRVSEDHDVCYVHIDQTAEQNLYIELDDNVLSGTRGVKIQAIR